jgi:hypothetical protein
MNCWNRSLKVTAAVLGLLVAVSLVLAAPPGKGKGKGPGGPGGKGRGGDSAFVADRDVFHFLLAHHKEIRREVKNIDGGVETVTESDNPDVIAAIQIHVPAMARRVKERDPIHLRDPLFAELFRNADKISLVHENTDKGVRVREVSRDAYTANLIQAHAEVVSLFLKNGWEEMHKNHAVPPKN